MITCCIKQYQEARFVGLECRVHRHLHIWLDPIEVYRRTTPTHACTPFSFFYLTLGYSLFYIYLIDCYSYRSYLFKPNI